MPRIGPMELVLILLIVLVVFGAGRLPELGRGLGEGIRNFKKGMRDAAAEDDKKPTAGAPQPPAAQG